MLSLLAQFKHGGFSGAHQIAHGFVLCVGDPNRRQLASAMEPGQGHRVSMIGLDPFARSLRYQGPVSYTHLTLPTILRV